MTRDELAHAIHTASLLEGEFRLRPGRTANHYFDKYRFESDPTLLREIAAALALQVPPSVDALAGLELGGVPIATMLSQQTGLPCFFVRKQAKEYGTCQLAEGGDIAGLSLLIVEDVVTSGGQVALSAADLRERGAVVAQALCVIDREEGGAEKLAGQGIELLSLYRASELGR
jgi:orotate phosphoribosyltransferase